MSQVLLVGIGNPIRRDDGAGAAVVRQFAEDSRCVVLVTHQLLPEHADELAGYEQVVFVDAAIGANEICLNPIEAEGVTPTLGHFGRPEWLAHLCRSMHGGTPQMWSLGIPVVDLGYGEGFSATALARIDEARRLIGSWLAGELAGMARL